MKTNGAERPVLNLQYVATLTRGSVLAISAFELDAVVERTRGSRLERHVEDLPGGFSREHYHLIASTGRVLLQCERRGQTEEWAWSAMARPVTDIGEDFSAFVDEIADLFGGFGLIKVTDGDEPILWTCYIGAGKLRPPDQKLAVASHESKTVCVAQAFLLAAIEKAEENKGVDHEPSGSNGKQEDG